MNNNFHKIKQYNQMLWKKGIKCIPFFLLIIAVTGMVIGIFAAGFRILLKNDQTLASIPVGIVIPDEDEKVTMISGLIEGMDSVGSICSFEYLTEEEAKRALTKGDLSAVIFFNEDMYNDVTRGYNTPVLVQISSQRDFRTELFRDLVESGVKMLQIGESTSYAIYDVKKEFPLARKLSKVQYAISMDMLELCLKRNNLWDEQLLSSYGSDNLTRYYTGIGGVILMLLLSVAFESFFTHSHRTFERALRRIGIGSITVAVSKTLVFAGILWFFSLILYVGCALVDIYDFSFVSLILLFVPAFSVGSFVNFVFGLSDEGSGIFTLIALSVVMLLISGGIFPTAYLPGVLRTLGQVLPFGIWHRCILDICGDFESVLYVFASLFLGILFLIPACFGDRCDKN